MKKLIFTVALMNASSVSFAADKIDCDQLSTLAKAIMKNRQANVDLGDAIKLAGGNEYIQSMIIEAWQTPGYQVKSNQQREIQNFGNKYYLACLGANKELAK